MMLNILARFSTRSIFSFQLFLPRVRVRLTSTFKRLDSKLVTMKLDSPQFNALFTPEVNVLSELFQKHGYGLRIAGGAVRDLLMAKQPDDLDFATTATPDEMKAMFQEAGIRMLHRKGEAHGTVTIRLNDKQNFEITTLRIDMQTDGRHAEVKFTTDWELDAGRRDLTFNAMFLDLDGTVYDYFKGRQDLENRRVHFVGNPDLRIQEDYLRILRYFRFYGRISLKADSHEPETLKAIQKNVEGLSKIAGERVWIELKKILYGNYAKEMMLCMIDLGICPFIGLPEVPNIEEYKKVCDRSISMKPHPITRLTALLNSEDEVLNVHTRLKFSKYDRDLALFLINHKNLNGHPPLQPFTTLIVNCKNRVNDTHEWCREVLKYRGDVSLYRELRDWQVPKFPLSGHILMEKGYKPGPKMNDVMMKLKSKWIESDFKMSKDELIECLDKNIYEDS